MYWPPRLPGQSAPGVRNQCPPWQVPVICLIPSLIFLNQIDTFSPPRFAIFEFGEISKNVETIF